MNRSYDSAATSNIRLCFYPAEVAEVEMCWRCPTPMAFVHGTWQCPRCKLKLGCCEGEPQSSCEAPAAKK
jgi:hypothetical protein